MIKGGTAVRACMMRTMGAVLEEHVMLFIEEGGSFLGNKWEPFHTGRVVDRRARGKRMV